MASIELDDASLRALATMAGGEATVRDGRLTVNVRGVRVELGAVDAGDMRVTLPGREGRPAVTLRVAGLRVEGDRARLEFGVAAAGDPSPHPVP